MIRETVREALDIIRLELCAVVGKEHCCPQPRSMLSQITAGIALRKTDSTTDRSAPNLNLSNTQEKLDTHKHESAFLDLGMEHWLPFVEDLSFPTASIALTIEDAELIRCCYKHLHEGIDPKVTLDPKMTGALVALGHRLTPVMAKYGAAEDGSVFTKLSGRSAKDAPLHTCRLDDELARRLGGKGDADAALAHLFDAYRQRRFPHLDLYLSRACLGRMDRS